MASVTEHLVKIQELTQANLDILKAINDSFFTKQNHLSVNVLGNQYAIPSFITLENKLNSLTANFENLVNSPDSGEAFFTFDGNSRAIQVRSYTSTPNSLTLKPVKEFNVETNDVFKDFMTPNPHINLNVQSLPNDTVEVVVKKIIPLHNDLIALYKSKLTSTVDDKEVTHPSVQMAYKDLYKVLSLYKPDVDYIEYDTRTDMPIRKNIGSGVYVIEEIVKDEIDENLDNYLTIRFRSDLTDPNYINTLSYRLFDETIERPLKVGDQLVTFEGNAKVEITEIRPNTNTLVVKVLNGEFLNLVPSNKKDTIISDLSKIRFYSPIDFDEDKYVKVPIEEDRYVFVAVAALNSRMNVQSSWGVGLIVDTYSLIKDNQTFKTFYDENVKNIGDVLYEITSMMSNNLTKYTQSEFNQFSKLKPIIDTSNILVTQINKHLNDSKAVQNIRSLYSQKKEYQSKLNEIQTQINDINTNLASISFDDTTGARSVYTSQLATLSSQKNELTSSISKIIAEISTSANDSEVPIENAKYRIRGFFDYTEFLKQTGLDNLIDHVKGIRVQYRYKNIDREQGNAMSINDKFIFSDWNNMDGFDRYMEPTYIDGYKYNVQPNNDNVNEPSFNQIDIPISQGETVDMRLKIVYDLGYPFICTTSAWSDIINIKFPEEYLKDVQILDIINENNDEIESNRFSNIIKENGVLDHVDSKVVDQDITYFHKPEDIASGFYTAERRIIPLKDKLASINSSIMELYDEIKGSSGESIKVSIKNNESSNELYPYQTNNISVTSYDTFSSLESSAERYVTEGSYTIDATTKLVSTVLNISLYNDSDHTVKLFSLFPGGRDTNIYSLKNSKFVKEDYATSSVNGVWFNHPATNIECSMSGTEGHDVQEGVEQSIQSGNQYVTFRIKNPYDGAVFYGSEDQSDKDLLSLDKDYMKYNNDTQPEKTVAYMYPKLSDRYSLSLDSNTVGDYLVMGPHEEIVIPIVFEYYVREGGDEVISKTMSFEIRPSLYKDPIAYVFKVTAKYSATSQDKVIESNKRKFNSWFKLGGDIKYRTIFK